MAANEMRSWGWLAGLVALGLAACLATAQERAAAAETNLSASTLPELLAAMLSANRAKGPVSIALSGDIYLDPDLLWTVPELRVDVALRGGRLLVDDVLAVCSLGTNVTLTLEGVALRYRRLVGLGTMFVGVVGLGRSGRLAMRNVTAEVTPRSFGHIEANLGGEYPAGRAEGIEKLPMGRGFSVASLTMGRVTVLESVFRATDESVAVWPEAYEQQVFRASQLVHQLRKAQTPDPLRPFRLTLARTMSLALEDVPEGPIQLRRKVVIRGPGEEGVGLYLFADLQGGKLLNVSQGGMLVFQDLTYDYQAAVPPTSQFGACTNLSCIDTDTMLPFTYDQSSAVCSYVSINTSMHTWCPFVTGLAKWLFLRQTSPGTDTTSSVVHLPGVAELAEFKAGDTESFSLASFIGSGTCVHNSEITCSEAEIDQSAGILKPPRGEGKRPELKDKPEKFKGEARTGTPQGIGVGVATAIGLVGVVLLSVTVFVFAVVLRRRIGKRGLDSEDGRWMDQPLAGGSSTCESEGSSGSPGQKSANHALQEAPAPAPVPMVEVDVEERGAGGGEGSVSMDPSSVSGGTLMERKWRELKEEMHKMNDDSVQLQEQIGSGGYGVVYKGVWRGLPVAIKTVMFQDLEGRDSKARRRAVYEAAISSSVVYPNVVQTYSYFFRRLTAKRDSSSTSVNRCVDWKLYIVQEFCQLGSLLRSLKRGQFVDLATKAPDMEAIVEVALGVARGMKHIHDHDIIHGDLTARNVLLQSERSGSGYVAKVSDFGLSVKLERYQNHISEHYAGTPLYMAPELGMHGRLSKAADVYSFGIMLWELFHLSLPSPVSFSKVAACRKGPPRFSPLCPMPYALLCAVCLSPHPSDRPDFEQIEEILERQLAMIRTLRFPKREDVEAFNSEWAKGIMGFRPREALAYMMCNLPAVDPADTEKLSTVDPTDTEKLSTVEEESAGAGQTASTIVLSTSDEEAEMEPRPLIPTPRSEEEPYYTQDPSRSHDPSHSRSLELADTPVEEAPRARQEPAFFTGLDSGEIQIELVPGGEPKQDGAEHHQLRRRQVVVSCDSDRDRSGSFGSSCTIEPSYSCDEQFMSVGWDSRLQGQGQVDKGLNPMGLLNYRQVANCTRSCERTALSQRGSGEELSQDSHRKVAHFTGRTTEDSDYFSV